MHSVKGGRSYMEDEHIVKNGGRFAAVFDGHGGSAVSLYLRQNLYASYLQAISKITTAIPPPSRIKHKLNTKTQTTTTTTATTTTPSLKECIKALRSAFRSVDNQVQQVSHWSYQGSTAVAVYLYEHVTSPNDMDKDQEDEYDDMDNNIMEHDDNEEEDDDDYNESESSKRPKHPKPITLISLNVGDSRAILSRDATAIALTTDHKPNHPSERKRIEKLGGQVTWCGLRDPITNKPIKKSGVYRMNGNLALSRAIGDRSERPWVSASVDVRVLDLDLKKKGGDEFIVIGTDGLWDVMGSQDVVDFVHNLLQADDEDDMDIDFNERRHMSDVFLDMGSNGWESDDGELNLSWFTIILHN